MARKSKIFDDAILDAGKRAMLSIYFEMGVPHALLAKLFGVPLPAIYQQSRRARRLGFATGGARVNFSNLVSLYQKLESANKERQAFSAYDKRLMELVFEEIVKVVDMPEETLDEILRAERQYDSGYEKLLADIFGREPNWWRIKCEEAHDILTRTGLPKNPTPESFSQAVRDRIFQKFRSGEWTPAYLPGDDARDYYRSVFIEVVQTLSLREEQVIRCLYALGLGPLSREELAQKFKVSSARIGQIRAKALRKLQHPSRSRRFVRLSSLKPQLRDLFYKCREIESIKESQRVIEDLIRQFPLVQELLQREGALNTRVKELEAQLPPPIPEVLSKSVEEMELSIKTYNCLKNANIRTIEELVRKTEAELLKTKNFGRKSLNEVKEILASLDPRLRLGMTEEDVAQIT